MQVECRSEAESDGLTASLLIEKNEGDMVYVYERKNGKELLVKQITIEDGKSHVWRR